MKILAIDLGGTTTKIALVNDQNITQRWSVGTDKNDLWTNIVNAVGRPLIQSVAAVGISMPGFIKHGTGVVILSGNLNLHNYDAQSAAQVAFARPVFVLNDANAAALGEYWKGANQQYPTMLFYTIGTGIGGGVIINGALYAGKDGYAGEFGHGGNFQKVRPCTCGLQHCIEPVSSAVGITHALHEAGHHIDVKTALAAVASGDQVIRAIIKEALRPLATHMCAMQTALNPDAIIVGGGPSGQPAALRAILRELVSEMQLDFIYASTPIEIAKTGNDAGLYGAAYYALSSKGAM